jgi:hypothetical protein
LQNRNKCALYGPPFQFIYIRVELWANHSGIKSEMLLATVGEQLGNLKKLMGTYREIDGNKGKKAKDSSPILPKKEKNRTPHESMLSLSLAAWKFCFQKCLCHYFWPSLMA